MAVNVLIFVKWQPSCSMRADGETDMTKLKVDFRNFANTSKTVNIYLHYFRQTFGKLSLDCSILANHEQYRTRQLTEKAASLSSSSLLNCQGLPGGLPYTKGHCLESLGRGGATGASDTQDVDRKKGASEFMWLYGV